MTNLISQLMQIRSLITDKQHRVKSMLADPVFTTKVFRDKARTYIRIEIHQYVFARHSITIYADGTGFAISESGDNAPAPIRGPDNFRALHKALFELGYTATPPTPVQQLAKLFSTARKPKPNRKGASLSRKKRRA